MFSSKQASGAHGLLQRSCAELESSYILCILEEPLAIQSPWLSRGVIPGGAGGGGGGGGWGPPTFGQQHFFL